MGTMEESLLEVRAVRESMGLVDRSDVGKLAISGPDRFTWLQGMISNDVKRLDQPRVYDFFRACVLDATGHLLSDLSIVPVRGKKAVLLTKPLGLPQDDFLLVDLPRENVDKIATLFDRFLITEDVEILDVTDHLGCFSFQGRRAAEIVNQAQGAPDHPLGEGQERVYTMPADYCGEGGFNAYFPMAEYDMLLERIRQRGVVEVGPEAQEILRVEAGIPKFGVDMDESVIALEANLGLTHISFTKGCYVGQEIIARIQSRGHTNRALTGLVLIEGLLPAFGDKIYPLPTSEMPEVRETGRITSVIPVSPALGGRAIALGYVRHEHRTPGSRLRIGEAGTLMETVEMPFYRKPAG